MEVPPKHLFLQEPHGVISQKTAFFIVTAAKTSNLAGKKSLAYSLLVGKSEGKRQLGRPRHICMDNIDIDLGGIG
jgi:hypothetical protein